MFISEPLRVTCTESSPQELVEGSYHRPIFAIFDRSKIKQCVSSSEDNQEQVVAIAVECTDKKQKLELSADESSKLEDRLASLSLGTKEDSK